MEMLGRLLEQGHAGDMVFGAHTTTIKPSGSAEL